MKYILGLVLTLQLVLAPSSWGQTETERLDRRYVIYDTKLGVLMLDTVLGKTWQYGWRPSPGPQCKGKPAPIPEECQLWGWFPIGVRTPD